eukprot:COSAG01_NODE_32_length_35644_cov_22.273738_28_plen_359_part_00
MMVWSRYYNVNWVQENASIFHSGSSPHEYTTSMIGNWTVQHIRQQAASTRPFFVAAGLRAPHGPSTPAPWYKHLFPHQGVNTSHPAWNNTGLPGKAKWIREQPPIFAKEASGMASHFVDRWRTLVSVDDLVVAVVDVLTETHALDNTFIFYSSDHGYHLGEFGLGGGKSHFYEFDSRVPMYVRGPGVQAGTVISNIGGNTDVAPTFLELAGVTKPAQMDGLSIVPLLKAAGLADRQPTSDHDQLLRRRAESWTRDTFLVEYTGLSQCVDGHRCNDAANNTYRGLRIVNSTTNLAYVQYTEAADWNYQTPYWTELYDLSQDPYQLENIVSTTRGKAIASELQPRLEVAWRCAGPSCKDV